MKGSKYIIKGKMIQIKELHIRYQELLTREQSTSNQLVIISWSLELPVNLKLRFKFTYVVLIPNNLTK